MPESARARAAKRQNWTIQVARSFEEAEAETRAYWHAATPAERLNALEDLRKQVYGQYPNRQGLPGFFEVVPGP